MLLLLRCHFFRVLFLVLFLFGGGFIFFIASLDLVIVAQESIVAVESVWLGFFYCVGYAVWYFLIILFVLYKRIFLVIGPLGVYYQKILKKGYFQWTEATITEKGIKDIRGRYGQKMYTTAIVKIRIQNGKKVQFISNQYRNKEFVKHVKKFMFLRLFQIYSELGRDKTSF